MAEDGIQIKMLGGFEIRVNGKPSLLLVQQSRKAMLLLQYLLLEKDRRVTHQELTDALWQHDATGNPDMALRAILHRFRNMIEEEECTELRNCILTGRGTYQWNPAIVCSIDVYNFRSMLDQLRYEMGEKARLQLYEKVVGIYRGRLLPASAGEPWVAGHSVELHSLYQRALYNLLDIYKKQKDYKNVVQACRSAMEVDMFDEHLQMELVMALEHEGRMEEAKRVSENAANLGYRHLANRRPRERNNAYRLLIRTDRNQESDIDEIRRDIEDADDATGAFCCEYATFRQIYQLQSRLRERYNMTMFLALVTVASPDGTPSSAEVAEVMNVLERILVNTLRRCDVVSRYSATQYVLLLAGVNAETGLTPLERIKTGFYCSTEHNNFELSYCLRAPRPEQRVPTRRGRRQ